VLPNKYSIEKGVRIEVNNQSEFIFQDNFTLGQNTLVKSFDGGSRFLSGKQFSTRRFCNIMLFGGKLTIGNNVFFNNNCSVSCFGEITIGDNTLFGENVKIYDHNHKHEIREGQRFVYPNDFTIGKVVIGANCWIATNVVILNNVEIGDNVIIGAGSVIYKSVPSNTIVKVNQNLNQETSI